MTHFVARITRVHVYVGTRGINNITNYSRNAPDLHIRNITSHWKLVYHSLMIVCHEDRHVIKYHGIGKPFISNSVEVLNWNEILLKIESFWNWMKIIFWIFHTVSKNSMSIGIDARISRFVIHYPLILGFSLGHIFTLVFIAIYKIVF